MAQERPRNKKIDELVAAMADGHQSSESLEILQRYQFHSRVWKPEVTVAAYVVELKTLAQKCY